MINVIVFSETAIFRAGLSAVIGSFADFEVQNAAGSLEEVNGLTEIRATWVIYARESTLPTILPILGNSNPILFIQDMDEGGNRINHGLEDSWGIVRNTLTPEGLRAAILAVSSGLIVHSPGTSQTSSEEGDASEPVKPLLDPLTEREQMVLEKLAIGMANKQIAQALNISENTVKFHISSIYSKLNASSRTDALRKGAKLGLVAL